MQVVVKKRDAQNAFREVWSTLVDPGRHVHRPLARAPRPGALIQLLESGDSAEQGRPADPRRRLHRGRARRSSRRTRAGWSTSSSRPRRSRSAGATSTSGGSCPPAAESGISRPSTGIYRRSPVGRTYDAFGSERYVLTFDNRALPRPRRVRAVRVRRDPRQRRRPTAAAASSTCTHRGRRQRLGAVHLRPRVRPPLRRAGRRVLHLRRRLPARERSASSRGSRTSRRCSTRRR